MAGFADFAQAIQMGAGLMAGFAHSAEQTRQHNEANQLALLKLLKSDENDIVPASPEEAQAAAPSLLHSLYGLQGTPGIFRIGGQAFKLEKRPPLFGTGGAQSLLLSPGKSTDTQTSTFTPETTDQVMGGLPTPTPQTPLGTSPTAQGTQAPINALIAQAAQRYGADPELAQAIRGTESSSATAKSPRGALGTFQLLLSTAQRYNPQVTEEQLKDPKINVPLAMQHIAALQQKYPGRPDLVAAAYFSGEGNVRGGQIVNPEADDDNITTREYVARTMRRYQGIKPPPVRLAAAGGETVTDVPEPTIASRPVTATEAHGLTEAQIADINGQVSTAAATIRRGPNAPAQVRGVLQLKKQLIDDYVAKNVEVQTKIVPSLRKELGIPIPPWVRTYEDVAQFTQMLQGFDPEKHRLELISAATTKLAQAVKAGDQDTLTKLVPVVEARLQSRGVSESQIKQIKDNSGYNTYLETQRAVAKEQATRSGDIARKIEEQSATTPGAVQRAAQEAEAKKQIEAQAAEERSQTYEGLTPDQKKHVLPELTRRGFDTSSWKTLEPTTKNDILRQAGVQEALDKPLGKRADAYVHPSDGGQPSESTTVRDAQEQGYVALQPTDKREYQNLMNGEKHIARLRTLLVGGPATDIATPNYQPKPEDHFPGILNMIGVPKNASIAERLKDKAVVLGLQARGVDAGELLSTYDQLVKGFQFTVGRGLAGERGNIPKSIAESVLTLIPQVTSTTVPSTSQADKTFQQILGIIEDRKSTLIGKRGTPGPVAPTASGGVTATPGASTEAPVAPKDEDPLDTYVRRNRTGGKGP